MTPAATTEAEKQRDRDETAPVEGAKRARPNGFVCMIAYTVYAFDARVRREAETLAANGFTVRCLTTRSGPSPARFVLNGVEVRELNVPKYRGKSKLAYAASYLWFLVATSAVCLRLLVARELDVVHAHNLPDFLVFAGLLPRLLGLIAGLRSRELFVIAVAVVAIGTAFAASALGVSVALGAFVAGLALAESDLADSVLGEIVPLRELFSTFFFVSIGILLSPGAIVDAWPIVLALLLIITLGKAVPSAALARIDGQLPSSAVRAGALIGQSGEFSFVLASTGLALGAVSPDSFSLAMGAVVLSILTAAPLLAVANRLGHALDARATLPDVPDDELAGGLRRHAVILGYGRVGHAVARVLGSRGFAWVAVDGDLQVAREARGAGAPVIFGEAGAPSVLDRARVAEAHALLIAMPDALATRQAAAYALSRNPRIEVVARAHSDAEEAALRRLGAARVVVAERELGNQLIRHALRRFGVSEREVAAILEARRRA